MTDVGLEIAFGPADAVTVVDCWDDYVADFGAIAAIQIEPRRWWLFAYMDDCAEIAAQLSDHGSLTPIGAGLIKASLRGTGWRQLLMVGGWFDAEDTAFGPGANAGTLIGHVSVRLHVVSEVQCDVYFAASYSDAMKHHWHRYLELGD